jgi:hypothetical protein
MHHAGIQFDDAFFIGKPAVADGSVLGVLFVDVDACDHGVQRIAARRQNLHGAGTGALSVGARNDDGLRSLGGSHSQRRQQSRAEHDRSAANLVVHLPLHLHPFE